VLRRRRRSAPSLNAAAVGRLQPNERVNFDAWTYGDVVNDVWIGQPDARWYRVPGRGWVATAQHWLYTKIVAPTVVVQ
jgi:hypothetical protein